MSAAISLNGRRHGVGIGKHGVIGIDEAPKALGLHGFFNQRCMAHVAGLFLPFAATALIQPHAADVLQEADSARNSSLIGEVTTERLLIDDSLRRFDSHQAPCARTEIGEVWTCGRNGCNGTCRVMPRHGNDGKRTESCQFADLFG